MTRARKDPIEIWEIQTRLVGGGSHKIENFVTDEGVKLSYEETADLIRQGQIFGIVDADGDISVLMVTSDGIIKTVKDESELNNLKGNTNLKETVLE